MSYTETINDLRLAEAQRQKAERRIGYAAEAVAEVARLLLAHAGEVQTRPGNLEGPPEYVPTFTPTDGMLLRKALAKLDAARLEYVGMASA